MRADEGNWRFLRGLSNDELKAFEERALERQQHEKRFGWLKSAALALSVLTILMGLFGILDHGLRQFEMLAIGFGLAVGYLPYRSDQRAGRAKEEYMAAISERLRRREEFEENRWC